MNSIVSFFLIFLFVFAFGLSYTKEDANLLFKAVQENRIDIVKELIAKGVDINVKDEVGSTPLHTAAFSGHFEIVKFLIENGADVNAVNDEFGETPIFNAVAKGHIDIVKYLIEKGARLDIINKKAKSSVLHQAVFWGDLSLVKLFVEKGVQLELKNIDNDTALCLCMKLKRYEMAKYLIEKGANVNTQCMTGRTPLHFAVIFGDFEGAKLMVGKGANPNIADNINYLPLAYAGVKKDINTIKLLSEKTDEKFRGEENLAYCDYYTTPDIFNREKALHYCKKAGEAAVNIINSNWTAAWYYLAGGDFDKSIEFADKSVEYGYNFVLGFKGHALVLKGEFEKAKEVYTKWINSGSSTAEVESEYKKLEMLFPEKAENLKKGKEILKQLLSK